MSTAAFEWADPPWLDAALSDEERSQRDIAAAFVRRRPSTAAIDDPDALSEMGAAGLFGATVPICHGGSGLGWVAQGLIARELSRVDAGYRAMLSAQTTQAMQPILQQGSEEQKQRYLPRLARGEWIACCGLAEPEVGADPAALTARARGVTGGYRFAGIKDAVVNAPVADILLVWARTDDGQLNGFVLERGMQHMTTPAITAEAGQHAVVRGRIVMDEVFVPLDYRLPGACGPQAAAVAMDGERYDLAWGALGSAEACWQAAWRRLEQRATDPSDAVRQGVRQQLAALQTEFASILQSCLSLGRLLQAGEASSERIATIQRDCVRQSLEIARIVCAQPGSVAASGEQAVARHLLNLEVAASEGSAQDGCALIQGAHRSM